MNYLAIISLFIWPPIVLGIFASRPPRRAVIVSFFVGWLFLPSIGWNLPGLPNWTKMSATTTSVVISALIFDTGRIFSIRPRWFDLPVVAWCLCPFIASISNNLGVYDGLSAVLDELIAWGLPYAIGRVYFQDLPSVRELALGFAIGGLVYIPLCLIEIRLSHAVCDLYVYGIYHWEAIRFGGYRPHVFLQSGLECGMWMACAAVICRQLWASGSVKMLRGYSFGKMMVAMVITMILCRSAGAALLMICGIGLLWMAGRIKKSWPLLILVAIPPLYSGLRTSGLWDGRDVVNLSKATLGADRAQSLEFRMDNEDILIRQALIHPAFGWGRHGGSQVINKSGKLTTIVDGYWIITLGLTGLTGLAALNAMMLLPVVLTIRRFPPRTWTRPNVGPPVALAVVITLVFIDYLSNAMVNPIYALILGALNGLSPARGSGLRQDAEARLAAAVDLAAQGHSIQAEAGFRRVIQTASTDLADPESRRLLAKALDGLGHSRMAAGRPDEAVVPLREAVALREELAAETPDVDRYRDLAIAQEGLGRALTEMGRTAEAIEERRHALDLWNLLVTDHPQNTDYRDRRVDALNDLAWVLATEPDPRLCDPSEAVRLAEEAIRGVADRHDCWNTLGVARCRIGDWPSAIEALEHSASTGPGGGTAFDFYFLAIAWASLGEVDRAREWFENGVAWANRYRPGHPSLIRFRDEAASLLSPAGLEEQSHPDNGK